MSASVRPLSSDEQTYVQTCLTAERNLARWSTIFTAMIIAGSTLYLGVAEGEWVLAVTGGFIAAAGGLGLRFFLSDSWSASLTSQETEVVEGRLLLEEAPMGHRQRIGDRSVIVPTHWEGLLRSGERRTAEVVQTDIGTFVLTAGPFRIDQEVERGLLDLLDRKIHPFRLIVAGLAPLLAGTWIILVFGTETGPPELATSFSGPTLFLAGSAFACTLSGTWFLVQHLRARTSIYEYYESTASDKIPSPNAYVLFRIRRALIGGAVSGPAGWALSNVLGVAPLVLAFVFAAWGGLFWSVSAEPK